MCIYMCVCVCVCVCVHAYILCVSPCLCVYEHVAIFYQIGFLQYLKLKLDGNEVRNCLFDVSSWLWGYAHTYIYIYVYTQGK